jgi:drug/metabolite transporter (DMT)-like permease
MWSRGIIGVVFCLAGLVWIAQGTNVLSGSKMMSGHGQYTLLGIVVLLIGLALLVWAAQVRRRQVGDRSDLEPGSGRSL